MSAKEPYHTTVTIKGVLLVVEYSRTDAGDILLSEVWIPTQNGPVEMMCLLADDIVSQIQDQIRRKPTHD